jgi:hypothetical protein
MVTGGSDVYVRKMEGRKKYEKLRIPLDELPKEKDWLGIWAEAYWNQEM